MGEGERDTYRRRYGVFTFWRAEWGRPRPSWMWRPRWERRSINDGGEDAPMGPRDIRLWRGIFIGIIVLAVAIAVVMLVTE